MRELRSNHGVSRLSEEGESGHRSTETPGLLNHYATDQDDH